MSLNMCVCVCVAVFKMKFALIWFLFHNSFAKYLSITLNQSGLQHWLFTGINRSVFNNSGPGCALPN